jgi:hypothetical protein
MVSALPTSNHIPAVLHHGWGQVQFDACIILDLTPEVMHLLLNAPTDPTQDPRFERIQRGGFFVWLWLAPLLFAYGWRITNHDIPMPEPPKKITIGLVGIFFVKAASRKLRHKEHGVIDLVTGALKEDDDSDHDGVPDSQENDFTEALYHRIAAAPNGMSVAEILAARPDTNKPRLYRAFDQLMKAKRLTRTGKPRTPDVRYRSLVK